jgi:hypothetical protein
MCIYNINRHAMILVLNNLSHNVKKWVSALELLVFLFMNTS